MPLKFSRSFSLVALATAVAVVCGCQGGKAPPPAPPPPLVTVARPVLYPVQSYSEYNGHLDAVETVQIKARVKGFLNEIKFKEGDEVKKNDLLYVIDPREYRANEAKSMADIAKAKADIENGKAQIRLAEAELERTNRAINMGAAAKTDLDKAVATVAANKAQYDVAVANKAAAEAALQTAQLELSYTEIHSPIDGRISRTLVTQGNLVGQNESTLLTTIVSVDPLYVYFDVPERDFVEEHRSFLGTASAAAAAERLVEVGVATEEGYPHVGKLDFRENRAEPGTGTVRMRGRMPNPVGNSGRRPLYPGLYARVRIPAGSPGLKPVIPEEALMTGQEGRYVYVVTPDKKVTKRSVTVGTLIYRLPPPGDKHPPAWWLINPHPTPPAGAEQGAGSPPKPAAPAKTPVGSVVAIEKGLNPDDVVIVNGLQKARPGAEVNPSAWQFQGPATK